VVIHGVIAAIGKYGCLLTFVDENQPCRTRLKMNVDGPSCISIQTQHTTNLLLPLAFPPLQHSSVFPHCFFLRINGKTNIY